MKTENQIWQLLERIDQRSREYDEWEYGLPMLQQEVTDDLRQIVDRWLAEPDEIAEDE